MSSPKESLYPITQKCEQGSERWHETRKGLMTGSHAQAIQACGKGLETYIMELLADKHSTGLRAHYTNEHMERGIELEAQAREAYEFENNLTVEEVGFVQGGEYWGASPDGLCEDYGIEIKCHADKQHFNLMVKGIEALEKKYWWQCQLGMMATGKKLWKYIAYNPNFKQSMIVFDITAGEEAHKKLLAGIEKGVELIKEIESKI